MPEIKISSIISFSSEDKHYPASNLLNSKGMAKWACEKPDEKKAIVELQFEEACTINQIDIGNHGSAFIEVLVKRSSSSDDYQVLLLSSSFMSPIDARSNTNPNQVRIFNSEKLVKTVASQKWDRVKIVCTQPFNKHIQYGIAFLKFFSPSAAKASPSKLQKTLSKFVIKSDDKGDDIKPGSLFAAKKKSPNESDDSDKVATTASQLRQSSRVAESVLKVVEKEEVAKQSDRQKQKEKLPASCASGASGSTSSESSRTISRRDSTKSQDNVKASPSNSRGKRRPSPESNLTNKNVKKEKQSDDSILPNVVFVLSGFQNPKRGQIRDKAIELGAKYRADWGPGCTHLICAFANTPKFNQIRGKGRIVKDEWIHDCHRLKKRLSWRKYKLGRAPSPPNATPPDSDEEPNSRPSKRTTAQAKKYQDDSDESEDEAIKKAVNLRTRGRQNKKSDDEWSAKSSDTAEEDDDNVDMEESDDSAKPKPSTTRPPAKRRTASSAYTSPKKPKHDLSDEEEEEENKKAETKSTNNLKTKSPSKPSPSKTKKTVDPDDETGGWKIIRRKKAPKAEDEDTDEEIKRQMDDNEDNDAALSATDVDSNPEENGSMTVPDLPNFFSGKQFFLFGSFDAAERRFLQRLIVAFDGKYSEYMSPDTNFVVTHEAWSQEFDDALSNNGNLIFVRPDWIKVCDKKGSLVPYQKYQVVAAG